MRQADTIEFTVLGSVVFDDVAKRKRVAVKAPEHLAASLQRLTVGDEVAVTYSTRKPTRSQQQLSYHFVLMGYLADYSGHSKAEMHEFVMRAKFGTKRIAMGSEIQEVRRSIADHARMSKEEMSKLIEFDLALCEREGVHVPTPEELGYFRG